MTLTDHEDVERSFKIFLPVLGNRVRLLYDPYFFSKEEWLLSSNISSSLEY